MSDRLDEVISDAGLLAHARRERGEALPVLLHVRGHRPQVELAERAVQGSRGPRADRPRRVSTADPREAREDRARLEQTATLVEELCGATPTILRAARALAVELDPAALRAAAEITDVEAIVPDREHRLG